jgi:hypothetical protein
MSGSAMKKPTALTAAVALFCAIATVGPAAALDQMKMGLLECTIAPSVGVVAGSSTSVTCGFTDLIGVDNEGIAAPNRPDFYTGSIDGVGLNAGSQPQVVTWLVFAPATARYYQGALAGRYAGVSAEATLGLGLGANVLVGGFTGSFALQPSSEPAQTGANIARGVTAVTLVSR